MTSAPRARFLTLCACMSWLLPACQLIAQEKGRIYGTVSDHQTGKPLPGTNVVIKEIRHGAAADSLGFFEITNLQSDSYLLEFRYVGYKTKYRMVRVAPDAQVEVSLSLEEDPVRLPEITVVDTSKRDDLHRMPSGSLLITREMIDKSGAVSITEAMRVLAPRLDLLSIRNRSKRSTPARQTFLPILFLVDGLRIQVDPAELQENPDWLDKYVELQNIDRIVVYRGQNAWLRAGRRGEQLDWLVEITRKRPTER